MSKAEAFTEGLSQILFGHEEVRLRNIKFCRGYKDSVEPGEISASVHSSILSIRSGQLTALSEFPDIERSPIDVIEFVKNL